MNEIVVDHLTDSVKVPGKMIYVALMGSRAYGTCHEASDYDYRGIYLPNIDTFFKVNDPKQIADKKQDIQFYDIVKFIGLAKTCNPNIIELLYVQDENVKYEHELMGFLKKHRDLFLSKIASNSFLGYAYQQLHRIKNHKKWIDNPVENVTREELGLPYKPIFVHDKLRALLHLGRRELIDLGVPKDTYDYLLLEQKYDRLKLEYKHYQNWLKQRNTSRAELERKYGYDVKHALHLFRLLFMAEYIAKEKKVLVKVPEVNILKAVLQGSYSYEELLDRAETQMHHVRDLFYKSDLKDEPDYDKIEGLLLEILIKHYGVNNIEKYNDVLTNREG